MATLAKNEKIQCPRCGGNGEVEHSHVMYGICFMCKGEGMVYPKRVGELTERAAKRKATIAAKREAKQEAEKLAEDKKWEKIGNEIYSKNLAYFNEQKEIVTEASESLLNKIKGISNLVLNSKSTEKDVREMLNDYFKEDAFYFKYQVSKWTLENYNFSFYKFNRTHLDNPKDL